jgi:hypothetical protein
MFSRLEVRVKQRTVRCIAGVERFSSFHLRATRPKEDGDAQSESDLRALIRWTAVEHLRRQRWCFMHLRFTCSEDSLTDVVDLVWRTENSVELTAARTQARQLLEGCTELLTWSPVFSHSAVGDAVDSVKPFDVEQLAVMRWRCVPQEATEEVPRADRQRKRDSRGGSPSRDTTDVDAAPSRYDADEWLRRARLAERGTEFPRTARFFDTSNSRRRGQLQDRVVPGNDTETLDLEARECLLLKPDDSDGKSDSPTPSCRDITTHPRGYDPGVESESSHGHDCWYWFEDASGDARARCSQWATCGDVIQIPPKGDIECFRISGSRSVRHQLASVRQGRALATVLLTSHPDFSNHDLTGALGKIVELYFNLCRDGFLEEIRCENRLAQVFLEACKYVKVAGVDQNLVREHVRGKVRKASCQVCFSHMTEGSLFCSTSCRRRSEWNGARCKVPGCGGDSFDTLTTAPFRDLRDIRPRSLSLRQVEIKRCRRCRRFWEGSGSEEHGISQLFEHHPRRLMTF